MKQNITVTDLNELSDKAKEKLRKWLKSRDESWPGVLSTDVEIGTRMYWEAHCISIGQMIEFLESFYEDDCYLEIKNRTGWKIENHGMVKMGTVHKWSIEYYNPNPWKEMEQHIEGKDELCDALWQAVKEVLESNNKITIS